MLTSIRNWAQPVQDMQSALTSISGGLGYQGALFPKNNTGIVRNGALMHTTVPSIIGTIELPTKYPNGSSAFLGDNSTLGYPPNLYPNLTYSEIRLNETFNTSIAFYNGQQLDQLNGLFLGPWFLNDSFSLLSITLPVINNTSAVDIMGWMTLVMSAQLLYNVTDSPEGLYSTGVTLLVGPDNSTNTFPNGVLWQTNNGNPPDHQNVRFVLPANNTGNRHYKRDNTTNGTPFDYSTYAAVKTAFTENHNSINNAGSMIDTKNEQGDHVAVGYATLTSVLVDWIILVEQAHNEVWAPISHLRTILLACAFGTAGGMLILAFPIAHYSSRPIRRLRDATSKSVAPPGYEEDGNSIASSRNGSSDEDAAAQEARKEGFYGALARWTTGRKKSAADRAESARRRDFRIPGKVKERKHFVRDELTELTTTFNEMTDELMMQYEKLEERVKQRTAELELSKKAAEAANESKTLFIANLSHELKTPLNGIMGMCAVCMSEKDPAKIQKSLGIIYKSGDLLLNLLTDLLTFSKNQVGQHLALDEKEFRLRDVSAQILAIFDKQAKDSAIDLNITYEGPVDVNSEMAQNQDKRDMGPPGTGRIKDMILWGDQHRILQVMINLVSNSLKFTPSGGSVSVIIRCMGDAPPSDKASSRKGSFNSRNSKNVSGRNSRNRAHGSEASFVSSNQNKKLDTALEINALESKVPSHVIRSDRAETPPPGRRLTFEFEVVDTGPGVSESQQQRIFEPFVQGDLGLSKKYGGTGLGLSICSQLASLMKGSIGMSSEIGHGSTFTMQIPLLHVASRADSTSSSTADPGSRRSSFEDPSRMVMTGDSTVVVPSTAVASGSGQVPFDVDSQPRLVGLSQPFFAVPTVTTAERQMAVVEKAAEEATEKGVKVRVLVAEDNKTNQEVVLRMLKLEDIFDVTVAQGQLAHIPSRRVQGGFLSPDDNANESFSQTDKKPTTSSKSPWNPTTRTTSSLWTSRCPTSTAWSPRA